jgi:membrane fusion protein, multidrug efflux system
MKKINISTLIIATLLIVACGTSSKNDLASKKTELEKLKKEVLASSEKIKVLEKEIAKLDTNAQATINENAKLIGTIIINNTDFKHYIDIQGKVDADNISYVAPRLGGGQVKAVFVKKGDYVKKGQMILKLDDAVARQSLIAAKQSLETIKTQVALAKDLYNRQNNLWKQGIGTEVQLISAKAQAETLEKQLLTGEANYKTAQEQASAANVISDVDGVVDELNVKPGEFFTGFMGNIPQVKIVNTKTLKVVTEVPENYIARVQLGTPVELFLTDINKTYNSKISFAGKTINPNNRSFTAEAKIPFDGLTRPNQNVQIKIQDYISKNTIAVPVNTIQTDDKGKYVYVAKKEGNNLVARKKQVTVGELSGNLIEIKSGLVAGDELITEGFQTVYDGQTLRTK